MSDITKETPQTNAVWQRHLGMTPKCCADALELAMKLERKNAKLREHARMSSVCRELKAALDKAMAENLAMRDAIRQFQRAKGRHNTEIAARRIIEMEAN